MTDIKDEDLVGMKGLYNTTGVSINVLAYRPDQAYPFIGEYHSTEGSWYGSSWQRSDIVLPIQKVPKQKVPYTQETFPMDKPVWITWGRKVDWYPVARIRQHGIDIGHTLHTFSDLMNARFVMKVGDSEWQPCSREE